MPLSRVLVALDFSAPSVAAAKWVAATVASDANVVLVHVVDVPKPPNFLRSLFAPTDALEESAVPGATARLEQLRKALGLPLARLDVRTGKAHRALQEAAVAHDAQLLVLGPHGDRTGLGRLIGSTAERTVREAPCPVLIAGGGEMGRPQRVVVAVDESAAGLKALAWGASVARQFGASLIAVHVVDALYASAVAIGGAAPEREKALTELRETSDRWLHALTAELSVQPGSIRVVVRNGHPADEIISTARDAKADLIVVGRNASGAANVLGSIADFVLRANTETTVVVPA